MDVLQHLLAHNSALRQLLLQASVQQPNAQALQTTESAFETRLEPTLSPLNIDEGILVRTPGSLSPVELPSMEAAPIDDSEDQGLPTRDLKVQPPYLAVLPPQSPSASSATPGHEQDVAPSPATEREDDASESVSHRAVSE